MRYGGQRVERGLDGGLEQLEVPPLEDLPAVHRRCHPSGSDGGRRRVGGNVRAVIVAGTFFSEQLSTGWAFSLLLWCLKGAAKHGLAVQNFDQVGLGRATAKKAAWIGIDPFDLGCKVQTREGCYWIPLLILGVNPRWKQLPLSCSVCL